MTRWRDKDPDSTVPYGLDLADYLEEFAPGDSILTAAWTASPDTLSVDEASISGTTVSGWFSGGADRTRYLVTLSFTTSSGLNDEITTPLFVTEG